MSARRYRQDDFTNFTNGLSDNFLYCRRYGHNWVPRTAIRQRHLYEAIVACARCGAERVEVINMHGEIIKKHMRYPEGYLATNLGRITGDQRNRLRLVALDRHIVGTERETDS